MTELTPMQIVGARIRQYRQMHGLTQAALAQRCHVHQVTVSEWERGIKTPSWIGNPSNRDLLAQALGVHPGPLFAEVTKAEAEEWAA